MSDKKTTIWDAETWRVYRRLLGYTRRYWVMGLISLVGMLLDGGGMALFTQLLQTMTDGIFVRKDAYLIFWMPIWIIGIFFVRSCGTFASNYGISYMGRHVVQAMQKDVFGAYLKIGRASCRERV